MMSFLREKMDRDGEMKREELEVRKRDRQAKKKERLDILRQNQALQTQKSQLLQVITQQQPQFMAYLLSKK